MCSSPLIVFVASSGPTLTAPNLSFSGPPNQDTVFQMGPHEGREEDNHHFCPSGFYSLEAAQDTVVFPGCKCTLLAHVRFFIHQSPQVLLHRAALCSSPNVWDCINPSSTHLVEPHQVQVGPLLKFVQFPLDGIPSFCSISLVSSASLLRMSMILLPISLIKKLNLHLIGLSAEAWGTAQLAYSKHESAWWSQEIAASFSYQHRAPTVGCGHVMSTLPDNASKCLSFLSGWRLRIWEVWTALYEGFEPKIFMPVVMSGEDSHSTDHCFSQFSSAEIQLVAKLE